MTRHIARVRQQAAFPVLRSNNCGLSRPLHQTSASTEMPRSLIRRALEQSSHWNECNEAP